MNGSSLVALRGDYALDQFVVGVWRTQKGYRRSFFGYYSFPELKRRTKNAGSATLYFGAPWAFLLVGRVRS